jgi:hypothetical protein
VELGLSNKGLIWPTFVAALLRFEPELANNPIHTAMTRSNANRVPIHTTGKFFNLAVSM